MARWKLMCPHYLNVPGTEWEYNETDLVTGEVNRVRYPVPRLLDPKDPKYQNADGDVVVCYGEKTNRKDTVFVGDPTPDMVPLDEEAQAISDSFQERWAYKPDSGETSSQSIIAAADFSKPAQVEGMADLVTAIQKMTEANQAMVENVIKRRL